MPDVYTEKEKQKQIAESRLRKQEIYGDNTKAILSISIDKLNQWLQYSVTNNHLNIVAMRERNSLLELLNDIDYDKSFPAAAKESRDKFNALKHILEFTSKTDDFSRGEVRDLVVSYMMESSVEESTIRREEELISTANDVTNDRYERIKKDVSDNLRYIALSKEQTKLSQALENYRSSAISNPEGVVNSIRPLIEDLNKEFSRLAPTQSYNRDRLMTNDAHINESDAKINMRRQMELIRTSATTNHLRLKSGYKILNKLTGGGFEGSRIYTFLAPAKHFKSGTLLNIMMTMVKYNDNVLVDKGMRPTITYLTMENTVEETYQRMYTWLTGENTNELINMAQDTGNDEVVRNTIEKIVSYVDSFFLSHNISLDIRYKASKTVNTDFLEDVYQENYANGHQTICVIQDYIRRINPASKNRNAETREIYGTIVDEMRSFAVKHDIPVLTASQLNKEAVRINEETENSGRHDAARNMGESHVAESHQIIENSDFSFIVNRENGITRTSFWDSISDDEAENIPDYYYLSVKTISARTAGAGNQDEYIVIPFEKNNNFRLAEDLSLNYPRHGRSIQLMSGHDLPKDVIERVNSSQTMNEGFSGYVNENSLNVAPNDVIRNDVSETRPELSYAEVVLNQDNDLNMEEEKTLKDIHPENGTSKSAVDYNEGIYDDGNSDMDDMTKHEYWYDEYGHYIHWTAIAGIPADQLQQIDPTAISWTNYRAAKMNMNPGDVYKAYYGYDKKMKSIGMKPGEPLIKSAQETAEGLAEWNSLSKAEQNARMVDELERDSNARYDFGKLADPAYTEVFNDAMENGTVRDFDPIEKARENGEIPYLPGDKNLFFRKNQRKAGWEKNGFVSIIEHRYNGYSQKLLDFINSRIPDDEAKITDFADMPEDIKKAYGSWFTAQEDYLKQKDNINQIILDTFFTKDGQHVVDYFGGYDNWQKLLISNLEDPSVLNDLDALKKSDKTGSGWILKYIKLNKTTYKNGYDYYANQIKPVEEVGENESEVIEVEDAQESNTEQVIEESVVETPKEDKAEPEVEQVQKDTPVDEDNSESTGDNIVDAWINNEDMSVSEVSNLLGVNPTTARSHLKKYYGDDYKSQLDSRKNLPKTIVHEEVETVQEDKPTEKLTKSSITADENKSQITQLEEDEPESLSNETDKSSSKGITLGFLAI